MGLFSGSVAFVNGLDHLYSAFLFGWPRIFFDFENFGHEVFVFDIFTNPAGIIVLPKVVQPGIVVHAFGKLSEGVQVLSAQVQLAFGTLE